MKISMENILAICPKEGIANGYEDSKTDSEYYIEALLLQLIKETANPKMKGFYCGIYSAYTSMILQETPWDTIWFMFKAASGWDTQEINLYK